MLPSVMQMVRRCTHFCRNVPQYFQRWSKSGSDLELPDIAFPPCFVIVTSCSTVVPRRCVRDWGSVVLGTVLTTRKVMVFSVKLDKAKEAWEKDALLKDMQYLNRMLLLA